jgi:hypothetical protein
MPLGALGLVVQSVTFGAVVMAPYLANHRGLETADGRRGWQGQVAPTVKRDGEALCIGFFDAADMTDGTGNMGVYFQEGPKVLPRETVADHAVRDEEQADATFERHFEPVMRSHLDKILARDSEAPVRARNPNMPELDLWTIAADPPGIPRAVRRMQRHASGHVCADALAAPVQSSVALTVANDGRTCGAHSLRWRAHAGAWAWRAGLRRTLQVRTTMTLDRSLAS